MRLTEAGCATRGLIAAVAIAMVASNPAHLSGQTKVSKRSESPPVLIPPEHVIQRFTVARDGDELRLPVRIGKQEYSFVVDTGATLSVFDASLPRGKPRQEVVAQTPQGKIRVWLYEPPDASVGKIRLGLTGPVAYLDLKEVTKGSGYRIDGILGMDFLGRQVVHIDFDRGELLFLKAAPKGVGEAIPIDWEPGRLARVTAGFVGRERLQFLIDTADVSLGSGRLVAREARRLCTTGELTWLGSERGFDLSGESVCRVFRGKRLALGGSVVEAPIFKESTNTNALGLGFWSRFTVTFDFPRRTAYLLQGKAYGSPDLWNGTGVQMAFEGDALVVDAVFNESPGARAGVREGDVLLQVAGLRVAKASPMKAYEAICGGGRKTWLVRRGKNEFRLTVSSPD